MRTFNLFPILLVSGILACGKSEVKPVDLYKEDICAYCKMAISDRMFAGEIVKEDGEAFKFDDLGCLRAFVRKEGGPKGMRLFFRAMEKDEWIKAESATLVKATMIQSPMGSGMIAFSERKNAEDFAKRHGGQLVALDDFLKEKSFHE